MHTYKIKRVLRVIDGDTIEVEIDLGFYLTITQKIRLEGINAPETRTSNSEEKENGLKSKEWLKNKLASCKDLIIKTKKEDKYGRVLGTIYIGSDNISLNEMILSEGLAVSYS